MTTDEKKQAPIPLLILFDVIGWFFVAAPATVAIAAITECARVAYFYGGWFAVVLASPFIFGATLILLCAVLFVFRLITPKVREGVYPFPMSPEGRAWTLQIFISRLTQMSALRPFFMGSSLIRFLYLRSLGAKCSYRFITAGDAWIVDPSLTEIGKGAVITGSTIIACHSATMRTVILKKTRIGARAQILLGATIGPGCRIGDDSTIGALNRLTGDVDVGERVYLGYQCVVEEGVTIGRRSLIGNRVVIEKGCRIGERAVIASGATVPKGTTLADGERFPARDSD